MAECFFGDCCPLPHEENSCPRNFRLQFWQEHFNKKNARHPHTEECYLGTHGWIPVDPTFGKGKFNRLIGFGKPSNYSLVDTGAMNELRPQRPI